MKGDFLATESATAIPEAFIRQLQRICPRVTFHVPMARLTTMGVGGAAEVVVEPSTVKELSSTLNLCGEMGVPWLVVGRGSNILVRDGGVRGILIKIGDNMAGLQVEQQENWVRLKAEAGLPLRKLLREAVRNGWGELEFLAGIPGNLGGAVAMNAGSHGRAIGALVEEVTLMVPGEGIIRKGNADLSFGYRWTNLPKGAVIKEVVLRVPKVPSSEVVRELRSHMVMRMKTQPLGQRSAGCIFKNPPGEFAGRLIEACGLKGYRLGGAMVSQKHANFIVNLGGATCADVMGLMGLIQETVRNKTGVSLEPEVRVVGEDG